jgi:hypothetical protein
VDRRSICRLSNSDQVSDVALLRRVQIAEFLNAPERKKSLLRLVGIHGTLGQLCVTEVVCGASLDKGVLT